MITIFCDGTKVALRITGGGPISATNFTLTWELNSEWAARLLVVNLQNALRDKLAGVKKAMYDLGWRHKAGKKHRKLTIGNFWGDLEIHETTNRFNG